MFGRDSLRKEWKHIDEINELRTRIDQLEAQLATKPKSDSTLRLERVESAVEALYKYLHVERVRVTTEVLDGLKRLVTETREEMRKVK